MPHSGNHALEELFGPRPRWPERRGRSGPRRRRCARRRTLCDRRPVGSGARRHPAAVCVGIVRPSRRWRSEEASWRTTEAQRGPRPRATHRATLSCLAPPRPNSSSYKQPASDWRSAMSVSFRLVLPVSVVLVPPGAACPRTPTRSAAAPRLHGEPGLVDRGAALDRARHRDGGHRDHRARRDRLLALFLLAAAERGRPGRLLSGLPGQSRAAFCSASSS